MSLLSITYSLTPAPPISVQITGSVATPTAGQSYTLTCSVTGASVTTYQWRKDGSVIQGETTETLSFFPLRLSHAGQYTCGLNVEENMFSNASAITLQGK